MSCSKCGGYLRKDYETNSIVCVECGSEELDLKTCPFCGLILSGCCVLGGGCCQCGANYGEIQLARIVLIEDILKRGGFQ